MFPEHADIPNKASTLESPKDQSFSPIKYLDSNISMEEGSEKNANMDKKPPLKNLNTLKEKTTSADNKPIKLHKFPTTREVRKALKVLDKLNVEPILEKTEEYYTSAEKVLSASSFNNTSSNETYKERLTNRMSMKSVRSSKEE